LTAARNFFQLRAYLPDVQKGSPVLDIIWNRFGSGLPEASRQRLKELTGRRRTLRPRENIAHQGLRADVHYFLIEGFLCRFKLSAGGRRTVLAYLLPGDFCGPHPELRGPLDHGIASLTQASVAEVSHHQLQECLRSDADLGRRLSIALLAEAAIQRQWLANMSAPSDKRLAHLLCELRTRLARVGMADQNGFPLPLTQHELGEALGISTVHVNRTLQHLKDIGLVRVIDHRVMIPQLDMLESFAEFDPTYLGFAALAESDNRTSIAAG
jgi:CRP-like cAMP-binding protein